MINLFSLKVHDEISKRPVESGEDINRNQISILQLLDSLSKSSSRLVKIRSRVQDRDELVQASNQDLQLEIAKLDEVRLPLSVYLSKFNAYYVHIANLKYGEEN